jgi:hypothetical protein
MRERNPRLTYGFYVGQGWRNQKPWRAETSVQSLVDDRPRGCGLLHTGVDGSLDGSRVAIAINWSLCAYDRLLPSYPNLIGLPMSWVDSALSEFGLLFNFQT